MRAIVRPSIQSWSFDDVSAMAVTSSSVSEGLADRDGAGRRSASWISPALSATARMRSPAAPRASAGVGSLTARGGVAGAAAAEADAPCRGGGGGGRRRGGPGGDARGREGRDRQQGGEGPSRTAHPRYRKDQRRLSRKFTGITAAIAIACAGTSGVPARTRSSSSTRLMASATRLTAR